MRLYVWILIHVELIYWDKALWYPKTSTLMRFIPHMPLLRLCLTPVTGSLYRPLWGCWFRRESRCCLWGWGGRGRTSSLLFSVATTTCSTPFPSAFSPWWGLVIASREILEPWGTKTCCLYGVEAFSTGAAMGSRLAKPLASNSGSSNCLEGGNCRWLTEFWIDFGGLWVLKT